MNKINKAINLAGKAHADQTYGDDLYIVHLDEVAEFTATYVSFGNNLFDDIVAAAWLHDIVEDTDITLNDVEDQFGWATAEIVNLVTDPIGETRKIRKAALYEKVNNYPSTEIKIYACLVKCADRYCNTNTAMETGSKQRKMYFEEFPAFISTYGAPLIGTAYHSVWIKLVEQYGNLAAAVSEEITNA